MCGIAGQINLDHSEPIPIEILAKMADTLSHRGPDRGRVWHDTQAGLAHRRLSIIDLSETADQPMSNEDGTVHIVFNGEIYNHSSLRESLIKNGHQFVSRTDTEVLVHLYEDMGIEMLQELRGMFAFALWDSRRRRLFAARDRAGKKPFKYHWDGNRLIFASELKALLEHPRISSIVDPSQIHQYLCFGYMLSPNTGLKRIQKLPAAHYLVLEDGELHIRRYWRLDYSTQTSMNYDEATQRLVDLLEEAVKIRLESDVPLGAFLSGGIDSAAVVAFMSKHSSSPVKTFSVGFEYESHNELPQARATANLFGCDHTEIHIHADMASILPELARSYEEPYGDSSALPSTLLARRTRDHVTVALNGDGGDENFAGYIRYSNYAKVLRLLGTLRRYKLTMPVKTFNRLYPRFRKIGIIAELSSASDERAYARIIAKFPPDKLEMMYRNIADMLRIFNEVAPEIFMHETFHANWAGRDPVSKALHWDNENYLAEDLCPKMDIATMAGGLEARSPLLDHKLLEFSATLPMEWKLKGNNRKLIFKSALQSILPRSILNRPKSGFGIPVHQWFRDDLGNYFRDCVLSHEAQVGAYLDPTATANLLHNHQAEKSNEGARLWMILTLELWLRWLKERR